MILVVDIYHINKIYHLNLWETPTSISSNLILRPLTPVFTRLSLSKIRTIIIVISKLSSNVRARSIKLGSKTLKPLTQTPMDIF